ncbi:hypothetical protein [Anaerotignum sp.]|uniref:hypothetical protein n=1 Tax=Anaerotignum sp. TaxID=2039241 RepID=UPI0027B8E660|nr:hypothetical protein [Anaerotignum sp.]
MAGILMTQRVPAIVFLSGFYQKAQGNMGFFYENEKKGCFIKISRKNHRKKIVKNKIGVTEKGLFGIS